MQQTLAVFNQPFVQIEAPSQLLVFKSCGLSSGVSQLLHGNFQFLSAKKAASTLQSTSCYNLRFAQGWRGSTKIGWNFSTTSQKLKIYRRKLPTILNLLAEISGRRRIPHRNLASWWNFCGEWVKKTEPFIVVLSLQESNLSSDLVDSATMASPRPFSAAGRFRDTRVIGENFNGGGL